CAPGIRAGQGRASGVGWRASYGRHRHPPGSDRRHMDIMREPLDRRSFLRTGLLGASGLAAGGLVAKAPGAWAAERAGLGILLDRPTVTHGVQSGDVTKGSAVIWGRADRPATMVVEWSTHESFVGAHKVTGPVATPDSDFTAHQFIDAMPPSQRIAYRVSFVDI